MNNLAPLVTDLMGTKLRTISGEEIGVVQNVMLNPSNGETIFIFLCYGNFTGKMHRHYAIPRQRLNFITEKGKSFFEIEKIDLINASEFDFSKKTMTPSRSRVRNVYELQQQEDAYEPVLVG
jgi:sporulation protein YlmC with PRC-barrel domain